MQKNIKYQCLDCRIPHNILLFECTQTQHTHTFMRSLHDWTREYVTRTRTCGLLAFEWRMEDEASRIWGERLQGSAGESEWAGEGQWIHSYMYEAKKLISKEKIAWPYDYWMRKKDYINKNATLNVERKMNSERQGAGGRQKRKNHEEKHTHTQTLRNRIAHHVRAYALLTV